MLDINEIKEKYNKTDVSDLKQQFLDLLSDQWNHMKVYFKNQDVVESIKYRTLYLYDEILNSVDDKYENISKSFFVLYSARLRKVNKLHHDEYQKCLDILNLFSDIESYLEKVNDVNLKNYYHLKNGVKLLPKIEHLSKEGVLC